MCQEYICFSIQINKKWLCGPEEFRGLSRNEPSDDKTDDSELPCLAKSSNTINYTDGEKNNNIDTEFWFFLII